MQKGVPRVHYSPRLLQAGNVEETRSAVVKRGRYKYGLGEMKHSLEAFEVIMG
jgi:hypothetical protein